MINARAMRQKAIDKNAREEKARKEKVVRYLDLDLSKIIINRAEEGNFDYYLPYENIPSFTSAEEIKRNLEVAGYETELREKSLRIDWSSAE